MLSARKKSAIALLMGIVGLCAAPAGAQKPPRLLFLGISKDGRASLTAENAVQLRLGGLDVSVVRPKELALCERADCLSTALALEHADLALTGRILKNEHACVATLWLAVNRENEKPLEHDIACRLDGNASELAASLADGAAAMADEYLRGREPAPALNAEINSPITKKPDSSLNSHETLRRNQKIKLISAFSVLLTGGLAATIGLASKAPPGELCSYNKINYCINSAYSIGVGISAVITGGLAASIGFLAKK